MSLYRLLQLNNWLPVWRRGSFLKYVWPVLELIFLIPWVFNRCLPLEIIIQMFLRFGKDKFVGRKNGNQKYKAETRNNDFIVTLITVIINNSNKSYLFREQLRNGWIYVYFWQERPNFLAENFSLMSLVNVHLSKKVRG